MIYNDESGSVVKTEPTLPQTTESPVFHFPQMKWLYENGFSIEKNKVDELLRLERNPLIKDLSTVIYDAIRRYEYFKQAKYEVKTHSFILHALYLLQELQGIEGLPALLEFLRQPEEILQFWLSDLLTEDIWQVVYATAKDQLPLLEIFLKEPLNYTHARTSVSTAISQLALQQPQRRGEIVALYKRLLDFYYEKQNDPAIFDKEFISFIAGDILAFNGRELTTLLKKFYDGELVIEFINGDWNDAAKELEIADETRKYSKKMKLTNIYENIDALHEIEKNRAQPKKNSSYSKAQPVRNQSPKTGRNDPCPCGSGKKYKKCCGRGD